MEPRELLVSAAELARLARETGASVQPATIRKWARMGLIPGARISPGGLVRFPRTAAKNLYREITPQTAA